MGSWKFCIFSPANIECRYFAENRVEKNGKNKVVVEYLLVYVCIVKGNEKKYGKSLKVKYFREVNS